MLAALIAFAATGVDVQMALDVVSSSAATTGCCCCAGMPASGEHQGGSDEAPTATSPTGACFCGDLDPRPEQPAATMEFNAPTLAATLPIEGERIDVPRRPHTETTATRLPAPPSTPLYLTHAVILC